MPFRCRQRMPQISAGKVFFTEGRPNPDTGIVEFTDVPQQAALPPVNIMDLAACLKAGVSLQKTNCKLVSTDSHVFAEQLNEFKEPPASDDSNPNPESGSDK